MSRATRSRGLTVLAATLAAAAAAYGVAHAAGNEPRQAPASTTMIAKCNADGGFSRVITRGAKFCTRSARGEMTVGFERSVRGCAVVASPAHTQLFSTVRPSMAVVKYKYEDERAVIVTTSADDGRALDLGFHVIVVC